MRGLNAAISAALQNVAVGEPASGGGAEGAATPASPSGGDTSGTASGATTARPVDGEKTERFVRFLEGVGPDKNMFRESMRLDFDACKRLAEFLRRNRIKALSLSHNHVGDEAVAALADAMGENTSLTALDLPSNDITDEGVVALANALKSNSTLATLNLHENGITDRGASALARLLISNTSLTTLNLSHNKLTGDAAKALIAAVACNTTIKSLKVMPGNAMAEKDARELIKAVRRNTKFSIKSLLGMA